MEPIQINASQIRNALAPRVAGPVNLDPNSWRFQNNIQRRVAEMQEKQRLQGSVQSLWDPIFNKKAGEQSIDYWEQRYGIDLGKRSWLKRYGFSNLTLMDKLFFGIPTKAADALSSNQNVPVNTSTAYAGMPAGGINGVLNWLMTIGETLDFLSYFVKSGIIARQEGMSYNEALKKSFGIGDDGREKMDFERIAKNSEWWGDGAFPVILGELLTDPLFMFAFGTGIVKSGTRALLTLSKESDDLTKHYIVRKFAPITKKFIKETSEYAPASGIEKQFRSSLKTAYRMENAVRYGDKVSYEKVLIRELRGRRISEKFFREAMTQFDDMAKGYRANVFSRFMTAADDVENTLVRMMGMYNPYVASMRGVYKVSKNFRKTASYVLKNWDELIKYMDEIQGLEVNDMANVNILDLQNAIKQMEEAVHVANAEELEKLTVELGRAYDALGKKQMADKIVLKRTELDGYRNELSKLRKHLKELKLNPQAKELEIREIAFNKAEATRARLNSIYDEIEAAQDNNKFFIEQIDESEKTLSTQIQEWVYQRNLDMENTTRVAEYEELIRAGRLKQLKKNEYRIAIFEEHNKLMADYDEQKRKLLLELYDAEEAIKAIEKDILANPKAYDSVELEYYKTRMDINKYEALVQDREYVVRGTDGVFKELRRLETRSHDLDFNNLDKSDWAKYNDFEERKLLRLEYDKEYEELRKLIQKQNDIIVDKKAFAALAEQITKQRKIVKDLENTKDMVEGIEFLLKIIEMGTAEQKMIARYLNKSGNESMRKIMALYAEGAMKQYEQFLNENHKYINGVLEDMKKAKDNIFSADAVDSNLDKINKFKQEYIKATRLSQTLGENLKGNTGISKSVEQTFIDIQKEFEKVTKKSASSLRAEMFEISNKFDDWFDEVYLGKEQFYQDKIKSLEKELSLFRKRGEMEDVGDNILHLEKQISEYKTQLQTLRENGKLFNPEEMLKIVTESVHEATIKKFPLTAKLFRTHNIVYRDMISKMFDTNRNFNPKYFFDKLQEVSTLKATAVKSVDDYQMIMNNLKTNVAKYYDMRKRGVELDVMYSKGTLPKLQVLEKVRHQYVQLIEKDFSITGTLKDLKRFENRFKELNESGTATRETLEKAHKKITDTKAILNKLTNEHYKIEDNLTRLTKGSSDAKVFTTYLEDVNYGMLKKAEHDPIILYQYFRDVDNGNPFAKELMITRDMQKVLRSGLKFSGESQIRYNAQGLMEPTQEWVTKRVQLAIDTYNKLVEVNKTFNNDKLILNDFKSFEEALPMMKVDSPKLVALAEKSIRKIEEMEYGDFIKAKQGPRNKINRSIKFSEYKAEQIGLVKERFLKQYIKTKTGDIGTILEDAFSGFEKLRANQLLVAFGEIDRSKLNFNEIMGIIKTGFNVEDITTEQAYVIQEVLVGHFKNKMFTLLDDLGQYTTRYHEFVRKFESLQQGDFTSDKAQNLEDLLKKMFGMSEDTDIEEHVLREEIAKLKQHANTNHDELLLKQRQLKEIASRKELIKKVTGQVWKSDSREYKNLLEELYKRANYGAIYNTMQEMFVIKKMNIPEISEAIDVFYNDLVRVFLKNNQNLNGLYDDILENALKVNPESVSKIHNHIEKLKLAEKVNSEEVTKWQNTVVRIYTESKVKDIYKFINSSLSETQETVIRNMDLKHTPKGMSSIFSEMLGGNRNVFRKTPFDDLVNSKATLPPVVKNGKGEAYTAKDIQVTSNGFLINGKRAKMAILDNETQKVYQDDTIEVFQVSIKNSYTGENKIYYLEVTGGTIREHEANYTGITDAFYKQQKKITPEEFQEIIRTEYGDIDIWVAHNAGFDFVDSGLFDNVGIEDKPILDTLPLLRIAYKGMLKRFGLESAAEEILGKKYLAELLEKTKKNILDEKLLSKFDFHNANFDTEVLHELIMRRDPVTKRIPLFKELQDLQIKHLSDLNDSANLIFDKQQIEILESARFHIDLAFKDYSAKELFEIAGEETSSFALKFNDDTKNIIEKEMLDTLSSALEEYKALGDELNNWKTGNLSLKNLSDLTLRLDEYVEELQRPLIKEGFTRSLYETDVSDLGEEVTAMIEHMTKNLSMIKEVLEKAGENQNKLLDAFYGNATSSLIKSKQWSAAHILSEYQVNRDIPKLLEVFYGTFEEATTSTQFDMSQRIGHYMREMLMDKLAGKETGLETLSPYDINKRFVNEFADHPISKLQTLLEEVDTYVNNMESLYRQLDRVTQREGDDIRKQAFASFYDLTYNMDKEFHKAMSEYIDKGIEPDLNKLRLIYNQLSIGTGANKFIKNLTDTNTFAKNYVSDDILRQYWNMAETRFESLKQKIKITDIRTDEQIAMGVQPILRTSGLNKYDAHIMLNPDTLLTNDIYHTVKEYFLDVAHQVSNSSVTRQVGETANQTGNTMTTMEVGVLYSRVQEVLTTMLENLRKPLRDIKQFNSEQALRPRHVGQMREMLHKELVDIESGAKVASPDMQYLAETGLKDETVLASLGAENVFKMSKSTKEVNRVRQGLYDFLTDLTNARKSLLEQEENFYKDLNFEETAFFKTMDKFVKGLRHEGDIYDLIKYAKSNVKKTSYRQVKIELMDNMLKLGRNQLDVGGKTPFLFERVQKALTELEEWAGHPFTTYLKNDEFEVDPKSLSEFLDRIKASVYDLISESKSDALQKQLDELFGGAKIKDDFGVERAVKVSDLEYSETAVINSISPHFQDSFRQLRTLYPQGIEGANDFIKLLKDTDMQLVLQVRGKNGIRLQQMKKLTPELVERFDALMSGQHSASRITPGMEDAWGIGGQERMIPFGIVDSHSLQTLQKKLKDTFSFREGSWQTVVRKLLLAPLKVTSLFSANFSLGNAVDITLKNMKANDGGLTNSYTLVYNTYRAMKMHSLYTKYYDLAQSALEFGVYGKRYGRVWTEAYAEHLKINGQLTEKIARELETVKIVDEFLHTEAAASEMNQMLLRMRLNKIGKSSQDGIPDYLVNKIFFSKIEGPGGMNVNPLSSNLQFNGWLETIGRLGLHIDNVSKGLSNDESLNVILKTHFNYSNKSRAEMYAEFFIPFISYPLRSFEYWSDALFSKGVETRALIKTLEIAWDGEIEDNNYAAYQASRGNIPIGNTVLQTGFTFMDATTMPMVTGRSGMLPDQLVRKINPVIKNLAQPGLTGTERVQRMPGISQMQKFGNIPDAFQKGTITEMFPSIADPYYKGSVSTLRTSQMYRNPTLSRPTTSNTVSFRMFGKYKYSSMDRLNYRWTNIHSFYGR